MKKGFTLLELLIVVAILSVLMTVTLIIQTSRKEDIYLAHAKVNFRIMDEALQAYTLDLGHYPPDVNRDIPPGLELYLKGHSWSVSPWPDSVYDWDNWVDPSTGEQIVQFSIRFCDLGSPSNCHFPNTEWAKDFDYYSSVYYCIQGPCRSHIDRPIDHPGLCVNCN
jgi:prepilin-type N-terminal cleavage/methylation domain-containing protein